MQLAVKHLNIITDKVNEKKSMGTDRVLFVLEDLHLLQTKLKSSIANKISQKIHGCLDL